MRHISSLSVCAAAVAALVATAACAQASPPAGSVRDGAHDMDFNAGSWHTEITRIPDPFAAPSKIFHMSGTVTVKPIWNGKGQLEEIEADGDAGHFEGANLFFYDPTAGQWIQTFVDSSNGRFDEPSGIGEFRNGTLEFVSPDTVGGRAVLDRAIFSDFKPDSHKYTESFSDDGGRTWHPAFVAELTRIKR